MKKLLCLILFVTLSLTLLFGCAGDAPEAPAEAPADTAEAPADEEEAPADTEEAPAEPAAGGLVFGYSLNDMGHEWYQNIAHGARERAAELGVEIMIQDAAMDVATQISQLESFIVQGVDVLIITPVDVAALAPVMLQAAEAGIPVITESNIVPGAETFVGIDNIEGGRRAGRWFAEYAMANDIDPRILIVGKPAFEDCRQRVQGFIEAMDEAGLEYTISQEVDGQGTTETSLMVSQDAFTANPDINVIFGINDNSTTGAMAAFREAGLDESILTAIGFGFEGVVGREALLSGGPYKAAVAMFPDFMGFRVVDAAYRIANGENLPDHFESGTIVVTRDNFADFYTEVDGDWITNFAAINALMD